MLFIYLFPADMSARSFTDFVLTVVFIAIVTKECFGNTPHISNSTMQSEGERDFLPADSEDCYMWLAAANCLNQRGGSAFLSPA